MSLTAYSPDVAPDLEPEVVRWQPRHKTPAQREAELRIVVSGGALAVLGLAAALLALGALAMGRYEAAHSRRARAGRLGRLRRAF